MDVKNMVPDTETGDVCGYSDLECKIEEIEGDQIENSSKTKPELFTHGQLSSSECKRVTDQVLTNGHKTDDISAESKQKFVEGELYHREEADDQSPQKDACKVEQNVERSNSPFIEQKKHQDSKETDTVAPSLKQEKYQDSKETDTVASSIEQETHEDSISRETDTLAPSIEQTGHQGSKETDTVAPSINQEKYEDSRETDTLTTSVEQTGYQDSKETDAVASSVNQEKYQNSKETNTVAPSVEQESHEDSRETDIVAPTIEQEKHQNSRKTDTGAPSVEQKGHQDSKVSYTVAPSTEQERHQDSKEIDTAAPSIQQERHQDLEETNIVTPSTEQERHQDFKEIDTVAPSIEQERYQDSKETDSLAAAVKENDVDDECLSSALEAEDEWMDILGNGQIKKKVLIAGKDSTRPIQGNLVKVKIRGQLENGVCIWDNTETFFLGDGDVIAAIDMSVALMNNGENAEVVTAARFAFGSKGRAPDVPGESTLILTLELLDIQPGVDFSKLTAEERLHFGEKKRQHGNELFGREDYSGAINSYSKAVKFLDSSARGLSGETSILQKLLESRLKCYNNMAASQLKVGATDAAIRSCEEVLKCQPENIKALYRLGKANSSKGRTDKAVSSLKKAIKLDPESKLLHRELAALVQKQKTETESEKTMYKRMMGSLANAAQKPEEENSGKNVLKWSLVVGGVIVAALSMGIAFYRTAH